MIHHRDVIGHHRVVASKKRSKDHQQHPEGGEEDPGLDRIPFWALRIPEDHGNQSKHPNKQEKPDHQCQIDMGDQGNLKKILSLEATGKPREYELLRQPKHKVRQK